MGPGLIRVPESLCTTTTCSSHPRGVSGLRCHPRGFGAAFYARSCKRTSQNSPFFRNCLENSRRRLTAPLWRQEAPESGLLRPLLAALGAQFRYLSRISKHFLHALG